MRGLKPPSPPFPPPMIAIYTKTCFIVKAAAASSPSIKPAWPNCTITSFHFNSSFRVPMFFSHSSVVIPVGKRFKQYYRIAK